MPPSFGTLLRKHRKLSFHPETGHPLTQEQLAEFMHEVTATISYWERDRRQIRATERAQLLRLLGILHSWGGLKTEGEANELLLAGGYRHLDEAEASEYLTDLLLDDEADDEEESADFQDEGNANTVGTQDEIVQKETQEMNATPNPTLTSILTGPDWPKDESRLAAIVLHLLGYPFDQFNAGQGVRLSSILLIWIFSAAIWAQALTWPFSGQSDMIQAWIWWGGMAVAAPGLLGLIIKADRQDNLITTTGAKRSIGVIRITGALAGYLVGSAIALLTILGMFFLALWPPAPWLVAGLAGLPLLIGYAAAKRMPLNHFRAFSPRRGEKNAFRLEEGDWVMLFAFCVLGPGLAAIFAVGQPWTWPPLVGVGVLGAAFMGTAALQLLAKRMGESVVPAEVWVLLFGVPLGLQLAIQPGMEPLLGLGLMAGLVVLAIGLHRRKETPRFVQMIGLLGILVGIGLLLQVNVWAGRVGALVGVWVAWRWLGDLFRQMAGFWLVVGLLVGCLLVLALTGIPPWVVRGGFGVGAVGVGVWEWGWGRVQPDESDGQ